MSLKRETDRDTDRQKEGVLVTFCVFSPVLYIYFMNERTITFIAVCPVREKAVVTQAHEFHATSVAICMVHTLERVLHAHRAQGMGRNA